MKCPRCSNVTLLISENQNVERNFCPECRGIWLDRSELDKKFGRSFLATKEDKYSDILERIGNDYDKHQREYDEETDRDFLPKKGYKKKSLTKKIRRRKRLRIWEQKQSS